MQILRWMQRAIQFVFDPEIYCLAWLAVRNQLKGHRFNAIASDQNEQKRAKAVSSQ